MTLTGSLEHEAPRDLALLRGVLHSPLLDQGSIRQAIERLKLEAARPSEIYRRITESFFVDLDVLTDVLASRVPA